MCALKRDIEEKEREKAELQTRLGSFVASSKKHDRESHSREKELWAALQKAHDENERTLEKLNGEKAEHVRSSFRREITKANEHRSSIGENEGRGETAQKNDDHGRRLRI